MDFKYVDRNRPKRASFISIRLIIAILTSLCPVVCYIGRQNLPFAIVSMVDDDNNNHVHKMDGSGASATSTHQHHRDSAINDQRLNDSVLDDDLGLTKTLGLPPTAAITFDLPSEQRRRAANATGRNKRGTRTSINDDDGLMGSVSRSSGFLRDTCPDPVITDESGKTTTVAKTKTYGPKYAWTQGEKGFLLGAFFYTYVLFQIPGARLAELVGAKWILAAASLGSAFLSFVAPWSASVHVHLFSAIRLIMGIFQAALYPACYVLYSKWLPPAERSQALPILCVGAYVGSIVASALTGYFSEREQFGWEYSFYVPGALCLIWSLVWIWFASNEPQEHKYISIEELQSIELRMEVKQNTITTRPRTPAPDNNNKPANNPIAASIEGLKMGASRKGSIDQQQEQADDEPVLGSSNKKDISWCKLFTSRSIWAMIAAFFASNWSFNIVLLLIPTYLSNILRVSPMQNGLINSVIYVIYCISSPLVGAASTMMVETRACGLSRLAIRKLFQGTALIGQSVCFVCIAWFGCDRTLVFGVLYVQIVLFSLVNGGEVQLPSELSVDFSGTIYAIGNCVGSSTGFIVPSVFSEIVTDPYSQSHWDVYFYTAAVVCAVGGVIFLVFGQNKMQDFSKDLDDSHLDFANFDGLAPTKGGLFNLNTCHQQQQAARLSSIGSLPPLKQGQELN